MKQVTLEERSERDDFAKAAAEKFSKYPHLTTYTSGGVEQGAWFAVKWGMAKNCVVTFKISDEAEVLNYTQIIPQA